MRQDYEAIAVAVVRARQRCEVRRPIAASDDIIDIVVDELSHVLALTAARQQRVFHKERFKEACRDTETT